MPARPKVDCEHHHAVLAVPDIPAAVDFYVNKLGFDADFTWGDPPTFAGVSLGGVQIHLVQGAPHPSDNAVYFVIGDADELFEFQLANSVTIIQPPEDQDYAIRDFRIRDLNGYGIGFGHRLPETGDPLEIERVDVSVRLEKRLAAALQDLAAKKGMSVSSCLEETLLHTFETNSEGGVPSPHTVAQLRYIQELKKKHGIDYDCHASYRFVEKP